MEKLETVADVIKIAEIPRFLTRLSPRSIDRIFAAYMKKMEPLSKMETVNALFDEDRGNEDLSL